MVGRLEHAAAGVQPRDDRNRAVLHAGRLVAGRHAEEVAQRQHAGAAGDRHGVAELEVRQAGGLDLQHRHVQRGIGAQELGLELPPVGQRDRNVVGVQARGSGR